MAATDCKKNLFCIGKASCSKKRRINDGLCKCDSWFSTEPEVKEACKGAALAQEFFTSREDFIMNSFGERKFIEIYGFDPIQGNSTTLEDSQRFQANETERQNALAAQKQTQRNQRFTIVAGITVFVIVGVLLFGGKS